MVQIPGCWHSDHVDNLYFHSHDDTADGDLFNRIMNSLFYQACKKKRELTENTFASTAT